MIIYALVRRSVLCGRRSADGCIAVCAAACACWPSPPCSLGPKLVVTSLCRTVAETAARHRRRPVSCSRVLGPPPSLTASQVTGASGCDLHPTERGSMAARGSGLVLCVLLACAAAAGAQQNNPPQPPSPPLPPGGQANGEVPAPSPVATTAPVAAPSPALTSPSPSPASAPSPAVSPSPTFDLSPSPSPAVVRFAGDLSVSCFDVIRSSMLRARAQTRADESVDSRSGGVASPR